MDNPSYPSNFTEILQGHNEENQILIKAQYHRVYEEEWNSKFGMFKDEYNDLRKSNHFHAILVSDFLKPFISDKSIPPYDELSEFSILILEPLYLEPNLNQPTFDVIISRIINHKIDTLIYIEAKGTRKVDNEYKKYKNYINDAYPLKQKIDRIIKNKYPSISIDINTVKILFGILIPEKRKNRWVESLNSTRENLFLFVRYEDIERKRVYFKIEWKPYEIDHNHIFTIIEHFFIENSQLCTTEFEMSNSLDAIYNLDVLMNEYLFKYQDDPINEEICKDIISRKAKAEYYENSMILDQFYKNIFKIGLKYNLIYCKGLDKKYYFRSGKGIISNMYAGFHLKESLEENDQAKKDILQQIIGYLNT